MKKILVIEDDLITQQFYAMFFKKRGFDSIITDNGDKVFETLASENVGVILMDINLSNTYFNGEKIDGIKLSQLIKANTDYNNIPLVLVTASSLSSQIKKFLTDTKAEDIVTKPILDYNRFVNKINYYIAS
ncbi:MAG: response regulator [Ignavibacteriales bacterium]|jgi:two-component system cell cycle response regulator DivK|nr:response regulator [Ignavibacteriales bacterium]